MKNILFAIGHEKTEEVLKNNLPQAEFKVIGVVTYKGGILKSVEDLKPDIVVIREKITGNENILDMIYEIKSRYPTIRVVFLADDIKNEDNKFNTLVSYGVYDILQGKTLKLIDMIDIIEKPRTLKDLGKHKINDLPFKYSPIEENKPTKKEPEKRGLFGLGQKIKTDKVMKDVIEPFTKELSNKEVILANTEKEIENLKEAISLKEVKIRETKERNTSLNNSKINLENELMRLKINQESIEKEVESLNNKKIESEKKYIHKKNEKVEIETEILSKSSEIEALNFQIKELKEKGISEEDKKRLETEKSDLEKLMASTNEEVLLIKKNIEEKTLKLDKLKIEYEKCKTDDAFIESKYEDIKSEINEIIDEKIKEKELIDSDFALNKRKLDDTKKEIESLEDEIENIKNNSQVLLDKKQRLLEEKNSLSEKVDLISLEADNIIKEQALLSEKVITDTNMLSKLKIDIETGSFYIPDFNVNNQKLMNFKKTATNDKDTFIEDKKVRVNISNRRSNRCQLVSFLGSKTGVGNSTVALNSSAILADGYKILYVETNEFYPCTSYLYELDNVDKGLEFALKHASDGNNKDIYSNILKSNNENVSDNIDFLTFSQSYLIGEKSEDGESLKPNNLKTLLREIKADGQYDYIIVDVDSTNSDIYNAFLDGNMYADIIFITLAQDIHSLNCAFNKKERILRNGDLEEKVSYIVNKYNNNSKLKIKDIAEWLEVNIKRLITVTLDYTFLSNLSIDGKFYSTEKGKGYIFSTIISKILDM